MKELREDFNDFVENDPLANEVLAMSYVLVKIIGYGLLMALMSAPAAVIFLAVSRAGHSVLAVVGFFIGLIPGFVGFMLVRFMRHRRNMRDPSWVPPDRSYHEW